MQPASGLVTALDPVMRACGGTWVAHGSGSGDRDTADARGRLAVPPDDPLVHPAARVADAARGRRLLLRPGQRRPVAAVPHRLRPAGLRRPRLARLRRGQPPLRRRRARRDQQHQGDRLRPGLPLRAAAADAQGRAARRGGLPVLAHPVAEPRGVPHLPVEGDDPRRAARQRPARVPHPVPLQQLPGDGGPDAGVARRPRALRRLPRRPPHLRQAVPDQHRPVAVGVGDARPRLGPRRRGDPAQAAGRRGAAGDGRRSPRLHQGHPRAAAGLRAAARAPPRMARAGGVPADRRADPRSARPVPGVQRRGPRPGPGHQPPLRHRPAGRRSSTAASTIRPRRSAPSTAPPTSAWCRRCTTA